MCIYNTLSIAKVLALLVESNDPYYGEDISCTNNLLRPDFWLLKKSDNICLLIIIKNQINRAVLIC
jgi:hypothetical protein